MYKLILASSSPHRLKLLKDIDLIPDQICSPNIDESRLKNEKTDHLVIRLAEKKAKEVTKQISSDAFVIGADTIVGTKAKIFDKANSNEEIEQYLKFFSGRRIYIKTAVSVLKFENCEIKKLSTKLSINKVKFKRLTQEDIKLYIEAGCGIGTSGGVNIQGFGQVIIKSFEGSISGAIGLPLYETSNLLKGMGYDCFKSKS